MKSKGKTRSYLYYFEIVAIFVSSILLLLSYISAYINPEHIWFISVFGLFFFPIFLLNLFILILCLLRRNIFVVVSILALLPSCVYIQKYVKFSVNQELSNDIDLKILSYNVGRFASGKNMSEKECVEAISHLISDEQPDLVCLQEFRLIGENDINKFVKKFFPNYNLAYFIFNSTKGAYGNITLSRFPIVDKGSFKFEQSSNIVIYTDCLIDSKKVRIYNCHFQSYSISLSSLPQAMKRAYKFTVKKTEGKLKDAIQKRTVQVDKIVRDIKRSPYKSFIIGDFNDGPLSYTYQQLMKYQFDSFQDAGSGFAATFSVLWPMLRVDYILYPSIYKVMEHRVLHLDYSDHYPITASFNIK